MVVGLSGIFLGGGGILLVEIGRFRSVRRGFGSTGSIRTVTHGWLWRRPAVQLLPGIIEQSRHGQLRLGSHSPF